VKTALITTKTIKTLKTTTTGDMAEKAKIGSNAGIFREKRKQIF